MQPKSKAKAGRNLIRRKIAPIEFNNNEKENKRKKGKKEDGTGEEK